MRVKEIKTLMTLDSKKFTDELKQIDKIVSNFQKDFKLTNKEIALMNKEFKALTKELKAFDKEVKGSNKDVKEMLTSVTKLSKEFTKATREIKTLKKEALDTKRALNEMTNVNLNSIMRLQSTLNTMKGIKLFDEANLNKALQAANRLGATGGGRGTSISNRMNNINNSSATYNTRQVGGGAGVISTVAEAASTAILAKIYAKMSNIDFDSFSKAADKLERAVDKLERGNLRREFAEDANRAIDWADDVKRQRLQEAARLEKQLEDIYDREQEINEALKRQIALRKNAHNIAGDEMGSGALGFIGGARVVGGLGAGAGTAGAGAGAGLALRFGTKLTPVIAAATTAFTALAAAVAVVAATMGRAVNSASQFQDAIAKFASTTTAGTEEVKAFSDAIKDGFGKQGYTNDIMAYGDALTYVHRNLQQTGTQAQQTAKDILAVSKVTGYDVKAIIEAQRNVMVNLGESSESALDMIMGLFQQTGDMRDDALDTFSEYSSQLEKTGISAEYFFRALVVGSQSGVMNLDKVGDTLKELYLRLSDPTDQKMLDALSKIGLSWQKLNGDIQKGGADAEAAFQAIFDAISKVQSKSEQQNIVTSLFGGPGEDIGQQFFEMMASGTAVVESFDGSVQKVNESLEQTWSVQLMQIQNAFKTLWEVAGEQVLPFITELVKNMHANMDMLKDAVETSLAPAFLNLAEAIAFALGLERPNDFAQALVTIINLIATMTNAVAFAIEVLGKMGAQIGLIWNVATMAFNTIGVLSSNIVYGIAGLIEAVRMQIENMVNGMFNTIIDGYNEIAEVVPGMDKMDRYTIHKNPWSNDGNYFFGIVAENNKKYADSIKKDWSDMKRHWNTLFGSSSDFSMGGQTGPQFNGSRAEEAFLSKNGVKTSASTIKVPSFTAGKYSGTNPSANAASNAKAAREAEVAEVARAAEEKLRIEREYQRARIQMRRELQADAIKNEIAVEEQKWATMTSDEALQAQYDFYDKIKEKYILTADEQIEYSRMQQDVMLQLQDSLYNKMVDARRKALDKELQAERDKNEKSVKAYEKSIREIEDKLRDLEESFVDEDNQSELARLQKEYEKYKYATSYEGTQRRLELEQEIAEKQKEIDREAQTRALEDQKRNLEDQITDVEESNDQIERDYQEKYDALEALVEDKEAFLKQFKIDMQNETNAAIKEGLETMVTDYEDAYNRMNEAALTWVEIQNLRIMEAKRLYAEAYAIGDTAGMQAAVDMSNDARARGGTIPSGGALGSDNFTVDPVTGKRLNPDWDTFQSNGVKWNQLQEQIIKNGDPTGKLKAEQNKLHASSQALRAKYGVKYPSPIPQYLHVGGTAGLGMIPDRFGEISAKLLPGEVVMTNQKFNKLMAIIDRFIPSMGINPALINGASTIINNNFEAVVKVMNAQFSSNTDIKQFAQEMNVMTRSRERANGQRRI